MVLMRAVLWSKQAPRPKSRPKTVLPYEDADKIERLVWAEARGEGVEGRNGCSWGDLQQISLFTLPKRHRWGSDPR